MGKMLSIREVIEEYIKHGGKEQLVYTVERPPKKPPQTVKPPKKLPIKKTR